MATTNDDKLMDSTYDKYCLIIDEWFVNGWNGTQAYKKYFDKVSSATASVEFNRILNIPSIGVYVKSKYKDAETILKTSHEAVLSELKNWAYSDITETIMLSPEQVKELPVEIRRLITKFKTTKKDYTIGDTTTTETVVELWFVSKEKAMEMIHKHIGFYEKDNTQKIDKTPEFILSDYSGKELIVLKELHERKNTSSNTKSD